MGDAYAFMIIIKLNDRSHSQQFNTIHFCNAESILRLPLSIDTDFCFSCVDRPLTRLYKIFIR